MDGLHLSQKCFSGRTAYGIRNIVDVLAPELSQLFCVAHHDYLEYCSPSGRALSDEECKKLEHQYGQFLLEELESRKLKLFDRGFLTQFRDYLCGDWTHFYLLTGRVPLAEIRPWVNQVPVECQIFIACVDAGYWEVYARDGLLLERVKNHFPEAAPCKLENRQI